VQVQYFVRPPLGDTPHRSGRVKQGGVRKMAGQRPRCNVSQPEYSGLRAKGSRGEIPSGGTAGI